MRRSKKKDKADQSVINRLQLLESRCDTFCRITKFYSWIFVNIWEKDEVHDIFFKEIDPRILCVTICHRLHSIQTVCVLSQRKVPIITIILRIDRTIIMVIKRSNVAVQLDYRLQPYWIDTRFITLGNRTSTMSLLFSNYIVLPEKISVG